MATDLAKKFEASKEWSIQPVGSQDALKQTLDQYGKQINEALKGTRLSSRRLMKTVLLSASRNHALLNCTNESLIRSVIDAAMLGLDCGGTMGLGYLIPFRNEKSGKLEASFMVGYRGFIHLARQSGEISTIESHIVYEKDHFEFEYGMDPKAVHKPYLDGKPGRSRLAYALCVFKDGGKQLEVMTREQVEDVRKVSKNPNGPAWTGHWDEMARKSVIRRLAKYLPLTAEPLQRAIEYDDEKLGLNVGDDVVVQASSVPAASPAKALLARLEGRESQDVAPPEARPMSEQEADQAVSDPPGAAASDPFAPDFDTAPPPLDRAAIILAERNGISVSSAEKRIASTCMKLFNKLPGQMNDGEAWEILGLAERGAIAL